MNTATLATAIQRDLLRTEPTRTEAPECLPCGRPFLPQASTGEDNTHAFCSTRCREAYDGGWPAYNSNKMGVFDAPMSTWRLRAGPPGVTSYDPLQGSNQLSRGIKRRGSTGWVIECSGCDKEFDSTGLRYCSTGCGRRHRERSENAEVMAKVGMEQPVKRKCEAPGCGRDIPNWRNGKRVSKATRFCSSRCKQAAYREKGRESPNGGLLRKTAKKAA
jgi:hypothetical protein